MKEFSDRSASRYSLLFIAVCLGLLLAQIVPLAETLPSQFESFVWHDRLLASVTEFRLKMGDRVFYDALVGPDGWLVYATDDSMDKYQNVRLLSVKELDEYQKALQEFQARVEANGAQLLLVAAPYKNTVYPEKVPSEITQIGETSQLDQILDCITKQTSIRVLDLRPALLAAKNDTQIYYATDTHWNDLGGFVAYQAILEVLAQSYPELSPHPISDFERSAQKPKILDLSYMIGSTSLVEERVQLRPLFKQTARSDSMVLPSGRQITFARNKNPNLPTALFLHDSFLYSVMPFLSEHFRRTFYVDMLAGNDMLPPAWVEQVQPDVVVIVLNEHFLDILPLLLSHGRPDFYQ
jgi:alginate O-acetyltransferase complex protein AlgJ